MKKLLLCLSFLLGTSTCCMLTAQNTFPASGNVGIGNANPNHSLSVTGTSSFALPPTEIGGIGTINAQETRRVVIRFSESPSPVSTIVTSSNAKWKVIFRGFWINNYEGGSLPQIAPYIELSSESPGIAIGTITLTITRDAQTGQLVGLTSSNVSEKTIGFSGAIDVIVNNFGSSSGSNSLILTGGVGIGTSTPVEKLQVSGGRIYANGTGTSSGFTLNNWSLYQTSSDVFNMRYNSTDVFTANAAGNVSIGRSAPVEKLQVSGGRIYANGTGTSSGFTLNNWSLYQTSSEVFNIRHNSTDVFTADAAGNVGIGTVTPGIYKLAVNGDVKVKKLVVTQTSWPDYVFKSDYKLRPLHQLEAYIRKNGHLPDMPNAKTIEDNGADIGANQAQLLKKIEELTLYIIDLEKRVKTIETKK